MRIAPFLVAALLVAGCATGSLGQPAASAGSCVLTPGDPTQGVDRMPGEVSWQARLGPGKELVATPENIAAGARGQRLTLAGRVLDARCKPLAGAVLDVWQVTADGVYGPAGAGGGLKCCYLTATVRTNNDGRFELETVMPGHYPGAAAHIHVGIAGPRGGRLLTEIQFANDPAVQGRTDAMNVVEVATDPSGSLRASFDFVIETG